MEFVKFNKIPRLNRNCIITEKIDGTNSQIAICTKKDLGIPLFEIGIEEPINYTFDDKITNFIDNYCIYKTETLFVFAGSRNRWLNTSSNGDNHGFAKWVQNNAEDLLKLGEGRHYGEWYGKGIQRGYGLEEKRFALFNVGKWVTYIKDEIKNIRVLPPDKVECPKCCETVPILYEGLFDTNKINEVLNNLKTNGSVAVPGFMKPEGIIVFHEASGKLFKVTCENDEKPKGSNEH